MVFADPGGWLDCSEEDPGGPIWRQALEKVGLYPTGGHLVKRVIGVGGDEVKCCDDQGRITVNGVPLNEKSYLAPGQTAVADRTSTSRCGPGYIWVQGDNRSNSADSRVHLGDPGGGQVPGRRRRRQGLRGRVAAWSRDGHPQTGHLRQRPLAQSSAG